MNRRGRQNHRQSRDAFSTSSVVDCVVRACETATIVAVRFRRSLPCPRIFRAPSRDASCTFGCCRHRDLHYRSRAPPPQFRVAREWFKPIVRCDVMSAVFARLLISLIGPIELNLSAVKLATHRAAPRLFNVPRRLTATPRVPRSIWTRSLRHRWLNRAISARSKIRFTFGDRYRLIDYAIARHRVIALVYIGDRHTCNTDSRLKTVHYCIPSATTEVAIRVASSALSQQ